MSGSHQRPVALTIAGVDSSGGAGIVADAKTFEALGVWATVAVTAVTAQNTCGVHGTVALRPAEVRAQIEAVVADLGIDAAKVGMLATSGIAAGVAQAVVELGIRPLVVDPVLASSHGEALVECMEPIRDVLLPLASVVTPNLGEAAALLGGSVDSRAEMAEAARALVGAGAGAALVTGGHLDDPASSADCLLVAGWSEPVWLEGTRVDQPNTHGGGCVLSAAITAWLAQGLDMEGACRRAKGFVTAAITGGLALGRGTGPVDPGHGRPAASPPGS